LSPGPIHFSRLAGCLPQAGNIQHLYKRATQSEIQEDSAQFVDEGYQNIRITRITLTIHEEDQTTQPQVIEHEDR
jgi:hypothetical protein